MGASTARSGRISYCIFRMETRCWCLTLALHAMSVDADAANHDIVNNREATFAAYPIPLAIPEATVR